MSLYPIEIRYQQSNPSCDRVDVGTLTQAIDSLGLNREKSLVMTEEAPKLGISLKLPLQKEQIDCLVDGSLSNVSLAALPKRPLEAIHLTHMGKIEELDPLDPSLRVKMIGIDYFDLTEQQKFLNSLSKLTHLTSLRIFKSLNERNAIELAGHLKDNAALQELSLPYNGFSTAALRAISDLILFHRHIKAVDLSENQQTPEATAIILSIIGYSTLKKIACTLDDPRYLNDLAKMVKRNTLIQELKVTCGKMPREKGNCQALQEAFDQHISLQKLELDRRLGSIRTPSRTSRDICILEGFSKDQINAWSKSQEAQSARVLVVTHMLENLSL